MTDQNGSFPTPETWLYILRRAYALFDDLEAKGFGAPPFSLGGGTALMREFKHRLSKDIDLFAYDVQWLSLFSPRLNAKAADMALDYSEQANFVKIVTDAGDIDFIVAGDVTRFDKTVHRIAGRDLPVDPASEILAKKLFYRAATLKGRDVYDMSAAIDLAPTAAARAARAVMSKRTSLLRRLAELDDMDDAAVLNGVMPYDGPLLHADGMVAKVTTFLLEHGDGTRHAEGGR